MVSLCFLGADTLKLFSCLVIVLTIGSWFPAHSAYGQDFFPWDNTSDQRRAVDQRRPIDERALFDERDPINQRFIDDYDIYIRDVNRRFGEYIDDVFVVGFRPQSYINALIIIEDNYFDISSVFTDIAIGAGVIIVTTVVLPAVLPGLSPILAALIKYFPFPTTGNMVTAGLTGAAFGSAINGTIEYIKSGGDLDATFNGILTGAGEGFKWAAITVAGASLGSVAFRYANATHIGLQYAGKAGFAEEVIIHNREVIRAWLRQFDSLFDVQLPVSDYLRDRQAHGRYATRILREHIRNNPGFANRFSEEELRYIRGGAYYIPGYRWHHAGTPGKIQLVRESEHSAAHIGGFEIWGQGSLKRQGVLR